MCYLSERVLTDGSFGCYIHILSIARNCLIYEKWALTVKSQISNALSGTNFHGMYLVNAN